MTDYRALCARMADELDHYHQLLMDDRRETHALAAEARASLAQPEPQGPTDAELHQLWQNLYAFHDGPTSGDVAEISRTALQRWGNLATKPDGPAVPHGREPASVTHQPTDKELHRLMHSFVLGGESPEYFSFDHCGFARAALARWGSPAIEPVSVSERLPGAQLCWWFEADEDGGYGSNWTLLRIRGSATGYTHWLPHHALPVPQ
jgi:hypothetical protein